MVNTQRYQYLACAPVHASVDLLHRVEITNGRARYEQNWLARQQRSEYQKQKSVVRFALCLYGCTEGQKRVISGSDLCESKRRVPWTSQQRSYI
jgi:hypothetical protein